MSVNWSWKHKLGEVTLEQKKIDGKVYKYKINMYSANCLCALIYDFKEKDQETGKMKNMYQFYTYFGDIKHLKRCLGLTKEYEDNLCSDFKKVRINTYYCGKGHKDLLQMAMLFTQVGVKVELYYKEPIESKSHSTKKGN